MAFPVPQIDHRTQRELVREALDRVPYHTTEWTNLTAGDPGVTLVQLFAFLAESVIYRANLIPERNRAKFLELLGVDLRPAAPARGLVSFQNTRGPLEPIQLAADREVLAGRVPFRTRRALTVLPVEGRLYTKALLGDERRQEVDTLYRRLYDDLFTDGLVPDYYETRAFEPPKGGVTLPTLDLEKDAADSALWLALLARPGESVSEVRQKIAHEILTVGVLPALDEDSLILPPGAPSPEGPGLLFQVPRLEAGETRYERLEARPSADLLVAPGTVELRLPSAEKLEWIEDLDPLEPGLGELPPSLADTDDGNRLVTWIRIRAPRETIGGGLGARLSAVFPNAAEVAQRAWVTAEQLASGTGEPNQGARLVNTPVLPETVQIFVNGELWQEIDDLAAAAPEVETRSPRLASGAPATGTDRGTATGTSAETAATAAATKVYTLDPESGAVGFGDGVRGTRPPAGATIVARYAYGGGRAGVVGIGAIKSGSDLPAGIQVQNPVPTWGGDDPETVAEAEHRIPRHLRHRDRLVAADDFREITWGAPGVDLGRVEVLPLVHPDLGEASAAGVVTLLLIPLSDTENPDNPEPDRLFLDAVCRHLEPRRLVTTELHLRGPVYRDLWVSAGVEISTGREQGPVLERIELELRRFLSPLAGGIAGEGWPLGKDIAAAELAAVATRVDGVSTVGELFLGDGDGAAIDRLEISGLELPRLAGIAVTAGSAVPLDELRGEPDEPQGPLRLPVPVIPEDC